MHVLIYLVALVACCSYAFLKGGAPERWGAAILLVAIFISHFVPSSGADWFMRLETGLMLVDIAMLGAVIALALRAQRYWPMWMAAILLNTIITHLLMLSPKLMPFSYSVMIAAWSYPNPLILAMAARRHQQRLQQFGHDPSWATRCPSGAAHGQVEANGPTGRF